MGTTSPFGASGKRPRPLIRDSELMAVATASVIILAAAMVVAGVVMGGLIWLVS